MSAPPPTMSAMRVGDAGAVDDRGRQHAVEAEHALEGEGHQDEEHEAEQAGVEDGLEGVGAADS